MLDYFIVLLYLIFSSSQVHGSGDGYYAESNQCGEVGIHQCSGLVVFGCYHVQTIDGFQVRCFLVFAFLFLFLSEQTIF